MLDGEHVLELHNPIPKKGIILTLAKVIETSQKSKGATITYVTKSCDLDGKSIAINEKTLFFIGARVKRFVSRESLNSPSFPFKIPHLSSSKVSIPSRPPDKTITERTCPDQALIYRQSGDYNPLHW